MSDDDVKKAWIRYLVVQPNIAEDFLRELEVDRQVMMNNLLTSLRKGDQVRAAQLVGAIDFLSHIRQSVISEVNEQMAQADYKGGR